MREPANGPLRGVARMDPDFGESVRLSRLRYIHRDRGLGIRNTVRGGQGAGREGEREGKDDGDTIPDRYRLSIIPADIRGPPPSLAYAVQVTDPNQATERNGGSVD